MNRFLSLIFNKQETRDDVESARLVDDASVKQNHGTIPIIPVETPKDIAYYWKTGLAQQEILAIFRYCLPLVITFLLGYGKSVVDVWFLGRTNSETMAAVSLANLFATTTGISIGTGMLTGTKLV